jgi:hypothetical protein
MPFQGDNRPVKYLGLKHKLEQKKQEISKQWGKYPTGRRMIEKSCVQKKSLRPWLVQILHRSFHCNKDSFQNQSEWILLLDG